MLAGQANNQTSLQADGSGKCLSFTVIFGIVFGRCKIRICHRKPKKQNRIHTQWHRRHYVRVAYRQSLYSPPLPLPSAAYKYAVSIGLFELHVIDLHNQLPYKLTAAIDTIYFNNIS